MEIDTKIKEAFLAVKKDIQHITKSITSIQGAQKDLENQLKDHKGRTVQNIDSASLDIRKEVDNQFNHIQDTILAISTKQSRNKKELKKQITNISEKLTNKEKDIVKQIESIDKDILTLNENNKLLSSEDKANKNAIVDVKNDLKTVNKRISVQDSAMKKVVDLKRQLSTKINDITALSTEVPDMKKELQDAIIALDDRYDKIVDTINSETQEKLDDIQERILSNTNNVAETKETISIIHKQIKETAASQKTEMISQIEQKDAEIKSLQATVEKQQADIKELVKRIDLIEGKTIGKVKKDIEKRVNSLEKKVDKNTETKKAAQKKKYAKKAVATSADKSTGKAKDFLYNLFFEEVDEQPAESQSKSKKN